MKRITISGQMFDIDEPYAEGHTCTVMEAKALNQTRAENIANNFRKAVKDLQGNAESLTDEQVATLQSQLDAYAKSYEFSVGGGRVTDPVDKEAKRIAAEIIDGKIAQSGASKKKYIEEKGQDKYDALIAQVMDMPEVRKKAEAAVKERNKLADNIQF